MDPPRSFNFLGMSEHRVILTTCSSEEEAERIARELLERKLVACVNIVPGIKSLYWWEGKVEEGSEILLLMKTRADKMAEIERIVKELHSYSVPEVIALGIEEGSKRYLKWIDESVG